MSSVPLLSKSISSPQLSPSSGCANPLPNLLQTPTGLAILEIQGTINVPEDGDSSLHGENEGGRRETEVGRLIFPDYSPDAGDSNAWMKRVYLYIGRNQRLTGEVKKLPKPLAVVRKTQNPSTDGDQLNQAVGEELEIVEIVKWKILFASRPEPVGG